MKPLGFDKRAYWLRAFVLILLFVAAAGYIYEWIRTGEGLLWACFAAFGCVLVILFSEWRRPLIILGLEMLGGLAILGILRGLVTGEPIWLGIIFVVGALIGLALMKAHEPGMAWLSREENLADSSSTLELNLRPETSRPKEPEKTGSDSLTPH
jgi:hypothetical protein